ncbi:hypothetical protein [Prosthecobacter sp.]|uniref:hypothetical protein n=1 Tax=Prosthecobacter sp. TaxID=1965333 RepID=UPI0037852211
MKTISLHELEEWQERDRRYALLDVLPDKAADETRLTESRCLDFVEKVKCLGVGTNEAIVLYETDTARIESEAASRALMDAGFHEVYCFTGPRARYYATQHGPP